MKHVIFWGGTGQAKVLREAFDEGTTLLAIFDNREIESPFLDVPIFHGESALAKWSEQHDGISPVYACVAVGGNKGADRLRLQRWLSERSYPPLQVIHRTAFVATDASLGQGCQILALAAICSSTKLGDAVIVNTSASIDHDCIIGNGVHIAPGARLAGEVIVGDCAFIGTGAVVLPRVRIGDGATVGAGAVVTKDVPSSTIVMGNPGRPSQTHK